MVTAFVLVDVGAGAAEDVAASIGECDGVDEVHPVAGSFDVIAEVERDEVRDVLRLVTRDIRSMEDVGTTRTYVALE